MAAAHCCCSSYLENMSSSLPRRIKNHQHWRTILRMAQPATRTCLATIPMCVYIYNYIQWECFYGPHPKLQGYTTIYISFLVKSILSQVLLVQSSVFQDFSASVAAIRLKRKTAETCRQRQRSKVCFGGLEGWIGAVGEKHSIPNSILSGND